MLPEVKAKGRAIGSGISDLVKGVLFDLSPTQILNNIEYRIDGFRHGVRRTVENGREWLIDGYKEHERVLVKIEGKTYIYKVIEVEKHTDGTFDYVLELSTWDGWVDVKPRLPYKVKLHHSQIIGKV